MPVKKIWSLFEGARGPDGQVRAGVWDRVCVPGDDEKDGQSTSFNLDTLSQMVDNFVARGDQIPLDFNHQSNYAHINGQPAPALAFYGALAVVARGGVVKLGCARGVAATGSEDGIDLAREGLWAYRCEVTELGQKLLPNFKYVSPTFMSEATARDGEEIGYMLAAVAATNTPWQSETEITFDKVSTAGAEPANKGASAMAKAKFAKFAGAADGADDAAIKQALSEKTSALAKAAMEDEAFKYDEAAKELEEMAAEAASEKAFEDDAAKMSKMAASFRRFSKFSKEEEEDNAKDSGGKKESKTFDDEDEKAEMAKMEEEKKMAKLEAEKDAEAKMSVMSATIKAQSAQLTRLQKAEDERQKAAEQDREHRFSQLADRAIAGGYPKENRDALIKFARVDFNGAQATVASFTKSAPSHIFDRASQAGAPIGQGRSQRHDAPATQARKVKTAFGTFMEMDGGYAEEIKKLAESKEPHLMAKVDKLIVGGTKAQAIMFNRLLAAEKVVRAEQPELAESAEQ